MSDELLPSSTTTTLSAEQLKEDRLYAFAGLAMQKLILMKPPKGGRMDVECDTRMAWELAYAMMETKVKMDAAGARKQYEKEN